MPDPDLYENMDRLNHAIAGHVLARIASLHQRTLEDVHFRLIPRPNQASVLALYCDETLLVSRPDNSMEEMARTLVRQIDKFYVAPMADEPIAWFDPQGNPTEEPEF